MMQAPAELRCALDRPAQVVMGGAPPPTQLILALEAHGFRVGQVYGSTETYAPATMAVRQVEWRCLDPMAQAGLLARQGVAFPALDGLMVADPETMQPVPRNGTTIGEIMLRGNTVMSGYLKNPGATAEAFRGGWFHTGDLGVQHPDGYLQVKDRSKDIIISGGEKIHVVSFDSGKLALQGGYILGDHAADTGPEPHEHAMNAEGLPAPRVSNAVGCRRED
jgi:fatty-acyl-CoA synthase